MSLKTKPLRLFARARAKLRSSLEKHPFIERLIKSLPLIILGLLFIFYFSRTELYSKFETSFLDTQMRLDNPTDESDVVIVDITPNDFKTFFESKTRPLNPPKLQELLTAVSLGKPCVIGVDIGTDFPEFADKEKFEVQPNWSPIVWVRDIKDIPADVNQKPFPTEVLGGKMPANSNSGIPLLIDDAQGVTRKYKRIIDTQKGKLPSFVWAIYRQAAQQKCAGIEFPDSKEIEKREKETSALLIKYSRGNPNQINLDSNQNTDDNSASANSDREWKAEYLGRTKIPASQIIEFAKDSDWQNNELIKNKIVLIGGSYDEDAHETPLERMWGVEITANAIESELSGGGIKPPSFLTTALIAVFDGFLLLVLFQIFSWRRAFLISLAALFVLSFICSFLNFGSFSYWMLYTPVMFGILLTELFDRFKDYLKDRYKAEIDNIHAGLTKQKAENKTTSVDGNKK